MVLPDVDANIFHHEAELVLIFSKGGKDIPASEAMDYVFGYTAGVDVSARMPGGSGGRVPNTLPIAEHKSHPTFCPLGPCIVTRDEIADPEKLQVTLSVDGELRVNYNTDDLAHSVAESIEYVAAIEEISPGDVLFIGTNHQGLGAMQDGDTIEVVVEGVGRFTFTVSDPLKRRWPKGIDEATAKDLREGAGGPGRRPDPCRPDSRSSGECRTTPLLIGQSRAEEAEPGQRLLLGRSGEIACTALRRFWTCSKTFHRS